MSYRKQPRLFFDLESKANEEALKLLPEPKAPGNLKDPEKIAAAIAEKKRELIETAALDPDYGRVLSIGYSLGPDMPINVEMVGDKICVDWDDEGHETAYRELTEVDIIENFWNVFYSVNGNCVGFNIISFDLPYLMRRSMYLGVKVPQIPVLAKFRTEPVTDLYGILYNWDYQRSKGLKQACKLLSIPNDCPDVDGSKVSSLSPDELKAYQASDVKLVMALYEKMNGVYFNL